MKVAMMNSQSLALVQDVVRRESLSMLNYVGDAFPWTTSRGTLALARLREIVHAHREAVAVLGRFLVKKRAPVGYIGSYPMGFTTINFLSLEYLLPRLAEDERRGVQILERELPLVTDQEAHAQLRKMLAVKDANRQVLEALSAELGKNLAG